MATLTCTRCKLDHEAAPADLPLPAELAAEVHAHICSRCWNEWQEMEVMVINELRLNFIDPKAQETLQKSMREFLELTTPE